MKRNIAYILIFAAFTFLITSCGNESTDNSNQTTVMKNVSSPVNKSLDWDQTVQGKNGNTVIDMTGLTIILEEEQYNGLSSGPIPVYQPPVENLSLPNLYTAAVLAGSSSGSGKDKFETTYENDMAIIKFRSHLIKLLDKGTKVQVKSKLLKLPSSPKQTIIIKKNGTISMRDYVSSDSPSGVLEPDIIEIVEEPEIIEGL